ncbi:hypothetical protein AYI68_g6712 [Smittium mucronatum]|uniref:Late embryogenesis abundant protein LEA-2 subgroup domain-containing protein n=1 Tax=Smittium mucronatum TaxID=133383 RepID=A0A1R0GQR7_9FUNG|nr:hypothetical protein AYI68_g6712 [Smittium mucronatum]
MEMRKASDPKIEKSSSDDHIRFDYIPPASPTRKSGKRCCFCCCRFSKKCLVIFLVVAAIFLSALATTGFFLWPRIPKAEFKGLSSAPNSMLKDISLKAILQKFKSTKSNSITFPLIIEIYVTNPNYIPWTINNVTVEARMKIPNYGDFPLGNGYILQEFKMPRRSVNNVLQILFNLVLNPLDPGLSPALKSLISSCAPKGPKLVLGYSTKITINPISWLIKPNITDSASFTCPYDKLNSLGINILELLRIFI